MQHCLVTLRPTLMPWMDGQREGDRWKAGEREIKREGQREIERERTGVGRVVETDRERYKDRERE